MVAGVPAVMQIGGGEGEETLFTIEPEASTPGEGWLRTYDTSIWVSSVQLARFSRCH
jgi:DEAD/DEAH box helicase domain-containing protein